MNKKLKKMVIRKIVSYLTEILNIQNYLNKEIALYGVAMKETLMYKNEEIRLKFIELKIDFLKAWFKLDEEKIINGTS